MALVPWPEGAPAPELPARPPSLLVAIALQTLVLRELWRRARRREAEPRAPLEDLPTVLVLPGMGVGDWTTAPLRRFLRRRGFDARGWGLGRHRPEADETLRRFLPRLEAVAVEVGAPVALVGWSLGGIVAREAARLRPDLVRSIATLGTPVVGGLRFTAIAGLFRLQGWDLADVERRVTEAGRAPIRVPVTALWSRRDGIVAWQACFDRATPGAVHLEARSCHWALGLDPDVLTALPTHLLRRPPKVTAPISSDS
jgi:pimeloyl-ACP methyl ester carboxylesterase